MQSSDYDVEAVNDLIASLNDSVEALRANGRSAPAREQSIERLSNYVAELGAQPTAGGAQRPLLGSDDDTFERPEAALERGEEHLRAKFERALSDADLAPRTHDLVAEAFTNVNAREVSAGLRLAA